MRSLVGVLTVVLLVAATAWGEATVVLKDGRRVTGQVIESGDRIGVATDDGLKTFNRDEVERIEHDAFGRATAKQLAAYRHAEREAQQVAHPAEALVIWRKYRDACSQDDPLVAEADKQIARWAEALKHGEVVWAGKSISPEQRDAMKARALKGLDEAVVEIQHGRDRKGLALLREAVRDWPDHPGAHFLMALVLQRQKNPTEAVRHYRAVLDAYPDHVPSLNNLAALECMRKQYIVGVPLMLRAVSLAHDVVIVNDNAYRTLLAIQEGKLRGLDDRIAKLRNAAVRFEAAMGKQGLRRWGSSWVTDDTYQQYQQKNEKIDTELRALAEKIAELDQQMAMLRARIAELERCRRSAPTEWAVNNGVDTDGDGHPDYFYARDALTKEKIDLLLAEHGARLEVMERDRAAKLARGKALKAQRDEPPRDLGFALLEEPGEQFLLGGPRKRRPIPLVPSYVGPTSVAELVVAVRSGRAVILARDGTFLGKVSANAADAQSILNPKGMFGSPESEFSLANPATRYTRPDSDQSASNPQATHPPRLFYDGNLLAHLTENTHLVPRIRLSDVLAVLRGE